ncbi:MAG: hypothetical protein EBR82_07345 [Caulobacteraceae bacterium]|nr:hypothetical protein [Caulobacteraceae bacterium]
MDIHHLQQDGWGHRPYVYRCDTCAAVILSKEDMEVHLKWHEEMHCDISGVKLDASLAPQTFIYPPYCQVTGAKNTGPCACCRQEIEPKIGNWDTV